MIYIKSKRPKSNVETLLEKKRKSDSESAYFNWLYRGASHGADNGDWLEAEQEMLKNAFERDPKNRKLAIRAAFIG